MAIADLTNVLNLFRAAQTSAEDEDALFKEVLLMTLARATSADANIDPCEVETVKRILEAHTGETFSDADIRLASRPTLYEDAPFGKYLNAVRRKLGSRGRAEIVQALSEVIKSDTKVRELEVDFFNMVANELRVTPAELVGLVSD